MTAATTKAAVLPKDDPEHYRMSIGEHLEELRYRLIMALVGFAVVFLVCLFYGNNVVSYFCKPLTDTLEQNGINPQMYYTEIGEPFMVFIRISLITGCALAAPWIVYQLWLFVAAGLYPHERKWVTKYAPLSIVLLISGMLFVYFLVLPWSIQFFIGWGSTIPLPQSNHVLVDPAPAALPFAVPTYGGDPRTPKESDLWFNVQEGKLKFFHKGEIRQIPFGPQSLVAPHITLQTYIDLVVMMLLVFGLAFQLPLVVAAILKIGIVEASALKSGRKYVYFGLLIVSAAITPGDVITATILLLGPLIGLYEMGIWLGGGFSKQPDESEEVEGDK